MEKLRICVGLRWMADSSREEGQAVLHARWMEFGTDASGSMCPGKLSGWEPVKGDAVVIQAVI